MNWIFRSFALEFEVNVILIHLFKSRRKSFKEMKYLFHDGIVGIWIYGDEKLQRFAFHVMKIVRRQAKVTLIVWVRFQSFCSGKCDEILVYSRYLVDVEICRTSICNQWRQKGIWKWIRHAAHYFLSLTLSR